MLAAFFQALTSLDPSRALRRARRTVIGMAFAGLCLGIGAAFLLAAGFLLAVENYGAIAACLGFGGIFILIAVLALVVHRVLAARDARRRASETKAAQIKTLVGATAMAALPALLKSRGGLLQLALPLLAIAAYAIYKENAPDEHEDPGR